MRYSLLLLLFLSSSFADASEPIRCSIPQKGCEGCREGQTCHDGECWNSANVLDEYEQKECPPKEHCGELGFCVPKVEDDKTGPTPCEEGCGPSQYCGHGICKDRKKVTKECYDDDECMTRRCKSSPEETSTGPDNRRERRLTFEYEDHARKEDATKFKKSPLVAFARNIGAHCRPCVDDEECPNNLYCNNTKLDGDELITCIPHSWNGCPYFDHGQIKLEPESSCPDPHRHHCETMYKPLTYSPGCVPRLEAGKQCVDGRKLMCESTQCDCDHDNANLCFCL